MMRYAGIFLMAGAAACGGFYGAKVLKERLEILCLLRRMIYQIKARILQGNDSLSEAFYEVGTRVSEQQSGVLRAPAEMFICVAGRLEKEQRQKFSVIWKEEAARLTAVLSKADQRNLLELGENLGYLDRDMQERTLLFYLERTDDSIAVLKAENAVKMKLYRYLGIAAGMFLAVVLI